MRVWRAVLIGAAVLSVTAAAFDILGVLAFGDMPSPSRIVRAEVSNVIVSVLTAWYLGWKLWQGS